MATRDEKRSILTIDLTEKIADCEQFSYIVSRICHLDLEPDLMNMLATISAQIIHIKL